MTVGKLHIWTTVAAAFLAALASGGSASAHGTYPSSHRAYHSGCYYTLSTGTWTIVSGVYMDRANGYPPGVIGVGGGSWSDTYGPTGGAVVAIDGHSAQWLYYRVVVMTQLATGQWKSTYGNWMRRKDALGDHTDGLSTEIQTANGWQLTSYALAGGHADASFANVGRGRKYVYGQMWWGPIYNLAGKQVFAPYTHWEPLGYVNCS